MNIEKRRAQLKSEIDQAKRLLIDNVEEVKLSNYVFDTNMIFPLATPLISDPMTLVNGLDHITRLSLEEDHAMRKIVKAAKTITPYVLALNQND